MVTVAVPKQVAWVSPLELLSGAGFGGEQPSREQGRTGNQADGKSSCVVGTRRGKVR